MIIEPNEFLDFSILFKIGNLVQRNSFCLSIVYCSKEKGLLLVKKFQDLDAQQPAPGEAEIQVYVNRGKTYIELESQGAYTTLKPKEELSWTVRWYLQPCKATSAEEIAKKVKEILHNN